MLKATKSKFVNVRKNVHKTKGSAAVLDAVKDVR